MEETRQVVLEVEFGPKREPDPDCVSEYTSEDGRVFKVGGRVRGRENSEYAFLEGSIIEMKMGPNDETENEGMCITVDFDFPDEGTPAYKTLEDLLADWSGLDRVEDLPLDMVIMMDDEIDPI